METLILPLLVSSVIIFGIKTLFAEGMVFEGIGNILQELLGEFWSKPFITCPPCMASVHGTWIYFAFIHQGLAMWVPFCLALAGLNYIVLNKLNS